MKENIRMMKKIVIAVLVILMAGIGIGCFLWMRRPGIHNLFGFMRVDVKQQCYLFNPKEDQFLGKTEVLMRGMGNNIVKEFSGEISVADYEVEGELFDVFPMAQEDSIWTITYAGITGAVVENTEGMESWKPGVSERSYVVYIDAKNGEDYALWLGEEKIPLYAVHANSEKRARQVFEKVVLRGKENVEWD